MTDIQRLLGIMRSLRDPETGCPWDIKQNFKTIAPYTIEEAYEVADAIEREHYGDLKEELGDLLLQVVFHSQMADEQGLFDFNDVVKGLSDKLVVRHPHVFADANADDEEAVKVLWEDRKQQERDDKQHTSILDDIPHAMPALMRAQKLQKRVARVGFDWPELAPVLDKVREELAEVEVEIESGDKAKQEEELGDLLFVVTNLVRHLGFKSEDALRNANYKFERRFRKIEEHVTAQGKQLEDCTLAELDDIWEQVKQQENGTPG